MTAHTPLRTSNSVMSAYPGATGDKVVLLDAGNFPSFSNYLNQSWTFSGTDWTNKSASLIDPNGPSPTRVNFVMAYDGTNISLVSGAGGSTGAGILSDHWVYGPSTAPVWTKLSIPVPTARYNAEGAFLNGTGAAAGILMFGGQNNLYNLLETQFFSGSTQTWSQITIANGSSPVARVGHMMSGTNANPGVVALFGGNTTNQQLNDLWTYTTASSWQKVVLTTSAQPSVRSNATFSYDITNSKFVLTGGQNEYGVINETWVLSLASATSGTWTQVSVPNGSGPLGRYSAQQCWDASSSKTILYGGISASTNYPDNSTWAFDGSLLTWAQL